MQNLKWKIKVYKKPSGYACIEFTNRYNIADAKSELAEIIAFCHQSFGEPIYGSGRYSRWSYQAWTNINQYFRFTSDGELEESGEYPSDCFSRLWLNDNEYAVFKLRFDSIK